MKRTQVWLLVTCIGIGAVFGAARGNGEKEAFLNKPLRETCKIERCAISEPLSGQPLFER